MHKSTSLNMRLANPSGSRSNQEMMMERVYSNG